MKSSLWIIIALVTGIVGVLVGYSISGFTGSRASQTIAAHGAAAPDGAPATPAAAAPKPGAAAPGATAGGYGGGAAHGTAAAGYGGAEKPQQQAAQARPEKVASDKPKAAGY